VRIWPTVILAAAAVAVAVAAAGCGSSGGTAVSRVGPPNPLSVSVLITNARVLASPARFGAGPVLFTVTNQASRARALQIFRGRGMRVADTAPLNPQGSTQVSVVVAKGRYTLTAGSRARTDAQLDAPQTQPLTIIVGRTRRSSGSTLLTP
jgi:hypothetical protein